MFESFEEIWYLHCQGRNRCSIFPRNFSKFLPCCTLTHPKILFFWSASCAYDIFTPWSHLIGSVGCNEDCMLVCTNCVVLNRSWCVADAEIKTAWSSCSEAEKGSEGIIMKKQKRQEWGCYWSELEMLWRGGGAIEYWLTLAQSRALFYACLISSQFSASVHVSRYGDVQILRYVVFGKHPSRMSAKLFPALVYVFFVFYLGITRGL